MVYPLDVVQVVVLEKMIVHAGSFFVARSFFGPRCFGV